MNSAIIFAIAFLPLGGQYAHTRKKYCYHCYTAISISVLANSYYHFHVISRTMQTIHFHFQFFLNPAQIQVLQIKPFILVFVKG